GGETLSHGRQAVRLQGDEDRVNALQHGPVISARRTNRVLAPGLDDAQAVTTDGVEIGTAGNQDRFRSATGEPRPEETANGAGAEHRDSHASLIRRTAGRRTGAEPYPWGYEESRRRCGSSLEP